MAYLKMRLKMKSGFMLRKVGAARMVVPVGPRMKEYKGVITINESGALLFEMMQKNECAYRELMDALIAEYGIDEKTADQAVNQFMAMCMQGDLLESELVDALPEDTPYVLVTPAKPEEEAPAQAETEPGDGE